MSPFTDELTAHPLEQYAEQHGTTAAAYIAAGWSPNIVERKGRPALVFQTKTGRRYRYVDGQKPKYDHDTDYRACWYGLERAVKFGLAFIVDCNGAPSTVPAQAKGIPAYSYQSGEMTAPAAERIDELKALWQGKVYVAFDCDPDGRAGAVKRVQLYRANGIDAEALDLGLPDPGADLADFAKDHTLADLLALPRLAIPDPEPRIRKVAHYPETDQTEQAKLALDALDLSRRDIYSAWVEIGMALHELGEAGLALWEQWSAGSEKYKPGDCARKWRSFRKHGITLATLFKYADLDYGPSWRPYKPPVRVNRNLQIADAPAPADVAYPSSVPIEVRGALLNYAPTGVAQLVDLWIEGIRIGALEPGEAATVRCLSHISKIAGRAMSERVIRSAVGRAADPHGVEFLTKLPHYIDNQVEGSLESESGKLVENPCKHPGRDPELYVLKPWPDILAALAKLAISPIIQSAFPADDDTAAPIRAEFLAELGAPDADELAARLNARYAAILEAQPGYAAAMDRARAKYGVFLRDLSSSVEAPIPDCVPCPSHAEYQAQCAKAVVLAAGGQTQMSHARLRALLGCSTRNLKTVLARVHVAIVKEGTTADKAARNMAHLRGMTGKRWDLEVRGAPIAIVSSMNSTAYALSKAGAMVWAEGEFKRGATVSVRFQQAHKQVYRPPRLALATIEAIQALLVWLLAFLSAPATEPEERQQEAEQPTLITPVLTFSAWVRLHVQMRLLAFFGWLVRNYLPPVVVKPHKESYPEQWLRKVTTKLTSWQADPERLVDRATGEVQDYSVQLSLEKLLTGVKEQVTDPLLDWICNDLGGRIAAIQTTVGQSAEVALCPAMA